LPAFERAAIADQLARAVREAGDLALTTFNASLKHWIKGKDSPVSEADIAVDNLLRERLLAIVPDAGWLSEETEDDPARLSRRQVWVVDPIDGTRAYIAGLVDWTISAALVEDGRPIVAAVRPGGKRVLQCDRRRGRDLQWATDHRDRGREPRGGSVIRTPAHGRAARGGRAEHNGLAARPLACAALRPSGARPARRCSFRRQQP
jgi:fructose-1,6-bisphosphatase/inositol monophosphatase family enzyme